MTKIAVFVSGRGSNFKAIYQKLKESGASGSIVILVSNKECPALEFARENGIAVRLVSTVDKSGFVTYRQLLTEFKELGIGLIVLAGFLKKIPDEFIDEFPDKIINVHPALLPSFGGKGMYGMNVHRAVFKSSAKFSGATVHYVDKIYDHGKIIEQGIVDIHDVESPEEIAERVLKIEHEIFPEVVLAFVEGRIKLKDERIILINRGVN